MASRGDSRSMDEQTRARASFNLGRSFHHGLGTRKDLERAAHWYAQADRRGCLPATVELAKLHLANHVPNASITKALSLIYRAIEKNFAPALTVLATLHKTGRGVQKDPQRAVRLLRDARDRGHPQAIVALGDCFRDGVGAERDPEQAVTLYREAYSRHKLVAAITRLAECVHTGIGMAPNPTMAFGFYENAANLRDTDAFFPLARAYATGKGTTADQTAAFKWFRRAADQASHPRAACIIARCYETGTVVQQCRRTAVRYWKMAAKAGLSDAKVALAECYAEGLGVDQDPKKAFNLFQSATDDAHPMAFVGLGECYLDELGVEHDSQKGLSFLQRAENIGCAHASLVLGRRYLQGVGLQRCESEAIKYFTKASVTGSSDAAYSLALCYLDGRGVAPDVVRAVELLKLASERGLHVATTLLARCLRHSVGSGPDVRTAFDLTSKAAAGGEVNARRDLALCYVSGIGCLQNQTEARNLLEHLVSENDTVAIRYAADLHLDGIGGTKNVERATRLYGKALRKGDPVSARRLAICHRDGVGLPHSMENAFKLLKRAVEMNDKGAIPVLARFFEQGVGVKHDLVRATDLYQKLVDDGKREWIRSHLYCLARTTGDDNAAEREAAKLHSLRAHEKDGHTETRLAYLLYKGLGVTQNKSEAIELIENLPMEKRSWPAMRILASCHLPSSTMDGTSPPDKTKTLKILEGCVAEGVTEGKTMYGRLLMSGFDGESRVEDGIRLLEEAAQEGSKRAAVLLGELYSRGRVRIGRTYHGKRDVDFSKSYGFFKIAEDESYGKYRLARLYMTGRGVEASIEKAVQLLKAASESDCALAQLFMCDLYERGTMEVSKDVNKALNLYQAAVHRVRGQTRGRAMYRYGRFLLKHGTALGVFPTQAAVNERVRALFKEANLARCVHATNDLGVLLVRMSQTQYSNQDDGEMSVAAFKLFEEAGTSHNLPRGLTNMAICFEHGIGVPRSQTTARHMYTKATERSDAVACSNCALALVDDGKVDEGKKQLTALSELEQPEATANLGRLYERGTGVDKDSTKALQLYHKAADGGCAEGLFNVAACYEDGIGTDIDERLAREWYGRAARLGLEQAETRSARLGVLPD